MTASTGNIITETHWASPIYRSCKRSKKRIVVQQGGSSSGKTYSVMQAIHADLMERKDVATVVGQDVPNLKRGAMRDWMSRIVPSSQAIQASISKVNMSDRTWYFKNGSVLEFMSYSDAQDAKSGKRGISFFNEANGIAYPTYQQVAMRTANRVYIDYNPSAPFWVHENLLGKPDVELVISNFRHNKYCDQNIADYLLELKGTDPEMWKVYGLGKTGSVGELVYPKFTIVPEMPLYLKRRGYGMDFGYRADPTALIECGLEGERDLYLDQIFYVHNAKVRDLDRVMTDIGVLSTRPIYADPADGRACDDLKELGWNIADVAKGPGSVQYGIQLLNQYNIFVTQRSYDLINELRKYAWKMDKGGKITNEPGGSFNHALDAVRYYGVHNLKPLRPISEKWAGQNA